MHIKLRKYTMVAKANKRALSVRKYITNIILYNVCNILPYTYVHLLVLATICNCSMHTYGSFEISYVEKAMTT
jgi:hypothetical protein